MTVLETERLVLREMHAGDAAFILELVNDPDWLRYIGDRGVRTIEDAEAYIRDGPVAMYASAGFGLWLVELRDCGTQAGVCGLLKRDGLEDVDVGFAFLPAHRGRGYAVEAAAAAVAHGHGALGMARIAAMASPDNARSHHLLEKIGFRFERTTVLPGEEHEVRLYASTAGH